MNTKKKRVCYQDDLQQLKLHVECSSSTHVCPLRKAYAIKNNPDSPNCAESCVINVLKDMSELRHHRICDICI
jgi:hypothetical protein